MSWHSTTRTNWRDILSAPDVINTPDEPAAANKIQTGHARVQPISGVAAGVFDAPAGVLMLIQLFYRTHAHQRFPYFPLFVVILMPDCVDSIIGSLWVETFIKNVFWNILLKFSPSSNVAKQSLKLFEVCRALLFNYVEIPGNGFYCFKNCFTIRPKKRLLCWI